MNRVLSIILTRKQKLSADIDNSKSSCKKIKSDAGAPFHNQFKGDDSLNLETNQKNKIFFDS